MTMTETTETSKPKTTRKRRRVRAKAAAVPAEKKPPQELAGLTITDCADACFAAGKCVISGSVCAHPGKGGLQAALQTPDTLRLFNQAKRHLGKQKLNLEGLD